MDMQSNTMAASMYDSKLREFFVEQLEDIYWAEQKLVKTLPKLEEAATTQQLKKAFSSHLIETQHHVTRLENVFRIIGSEARATKCPAMAGIVEEGEEIIDNTETGTSQRDVGLIFAAQKAEHYEIATYGGLVQLARTLGQNEAADLLAQTLEEEKATDSTLTNIAEDGINYQASQEKTEL
jgi:ferritin-like metal-binding protein YciE